MRIVIFSDTFPPEINGVATSCKNLMDTLVAHGQDVITVTTNPFSNQFSYIDHIIRVPGIEMKKLYGYRAASFYSPKAMEIIKAFKPDVCHIQHDAGIGQFGYIVSSTLDVPSVTTFHTAYEDYTYYATKGHFDRFAKNAVRVYFRFLSRRADELVTPSYKTKEYMRSIGVDKYISVVPTGIDFSAFSPQNVDMSEVKRIREELGLPSNKKILLSLGRIAKEKSIDVLLRGYANYVDEHKDNPTYFLIVGGGPELDSLKSLAKELGLEGSVGFAGPVKPDRVPLYYALGDFFLSASVTETQGLTFMEAMAAHLVLFIRYDQALATTISDGESGFFFQDEFDFSQKLEGLLALPTPILDGVKEKALSSLAPYSLDRFAESIMEVYGRAIRKHW